jgi:hypothetical protein
MTGTTISVKTSDSNTWFYDFSASVTFCNSISVVKFDYKDPVGLLCAGNATTFGAGPFTQHTAVGGPGSLSQCGGAGNWTFLVTATDSANQTTTASMPFKVAVSNH